MRACLLILSLAGLPGPLPAAGSGPEPGAGLTAEISAFLARYAELYNHQDYATLLTMWDRDEANPVYLAEEIDPPMLGWQKINAYFARPGVLDGIRNEYSDVRAHYLAPDLALATYRLRFDIKVRGMQPLSSWDRVMAVFRRKDGDWKLVAYAEAPMAPLTMVRRMVRQSELPPAGQQALLDQVQALLEQAVPVDFATWLERQQATD